MYTIRNSSHLNVLLVFVLMVSLLAFFSVGCTGGEDDYEEYWDEDFEGFEDDWNDDNAIEDNDIDDNAD